MARYTDAVCRLCRREGIKLFLKGTKCFSDKCPIEKRNFAPGQHGKDRKTKVVGYGLQLREKQKAKRIYFTQEGQFRNYFEKAARSKGVTGELRDPKYQEEAVRTAEYRQGTLIRDSIRRLIAASNAEDCFHRAQNMGISWAMVGGAEENYGLTHYEQRGYWRNVEHPQIGRAIPYPRGPFACDALGTEPRGRAPNLGEHTLQVLTQDLGLNAQAITALAAAGVALTAAGVMQ